MHIGTQGCNIAGIISDSTTSISRVLIGPTTSTLYITCCYIVKPVGDDKRLSFINESLNRSY